jgi:hypothetical protein
MNKESFNDEHNEDNNNYNYNNNLNIDDNIKRDYKFVSFLDNDKNADQSPYILIKDNYINDVSQSAAHRKSVFSSNIQEITEQPKLYQQLLSKDRQKSLFYNIIVLAFFNINVAHFCFGYLANRIGIMFSLLILILSGIYSYWIQGLLIKYLTHITEATPCNYACLIQNNFGSFCSLVLEISVIVWLGILNVVFIMTCKNTIKKIIY